MRTTAASHFTNFPYIVQLFPTGKAGRLPRDRLLRWMLKMLKVGEVKKREFAAAEGL